MRKNKEVGVALDLVGGWLDAPYSRRYRCMHGLITVISNDRRRPALLALQLRGQNTSAAINSIK